LPPTSSTTIELEWTVPYGAGSAVIDYSLEVESGGVWTVLQSDISVLTYTYSPTVPGDTYSFRMKSRNIFGSSINYSDTVDVLSSVAADAPDMPTATVVEDSVVITWTTPVTNGEPVLSYKVMIRTSDDMTYEQELNSCDGSDPAIISALSCTVPIAYLITAPYNLVGGDNMYIKVIAVSMCGDSDDSPIN
jgi:hypothetical protein